MIRLLKEAEEKTLVEPVAADTQTPPEVSNTEEVVDAKKIAITACEDAVRDLTHAAWDFISTTNSVIATLDLYYTEKSKDGVINLLNTIVDDSTINIGILQKVMGLINSKKTDLLDAGETKAEEILAEN